MYRTVTDDMPAPKRQRTNKHYAKKRASAIVRVPRAISTRGTPDGYYEIPMRQLFRIYGNTSTGLWNTNQTTGAPIGATGYQGLGIYAALDNTYINLGNGAVSAVITQSVPDFASAQNLFDLCKIVDMKVEIWYTNHSRDLSSTGTVYGAPELFLAEDLNDAFPPSSINTVLDKKKVLRCSAMQDKKFTMMTKPYLTTDASSNDGSGVSTATAVAQPSTYVRCAVPSVSHFGIKGWSALPTAADSYLYEVNILITQTRRYKMNN